MKLRASFIIAVLCFVLTPQNAWGTWWNFIHCYAGESLHGDNNPPKRESDPDTTAEQCHGKAGDYGTCEDTIDDDTFYVSCYQTPTGTKCTGSMACDGSTEAKLCTGADEVFSGTEAGRGYLLCFKDGELSTEYRCGLLA